MAESDYYYKGKPERHLKGFLVVGIHHEPPNQVAEAARLAVSGKSGVSGGSGVFWGVRGVCDVWGASALLLSEENTVYVSGSFLCDIGKEKPVSNMGIVHVLFHFFFQTV